jgi:hypothetical protein
VKRLPINLSPQSAVRWNLRASGSRPRGWFRACCVPAALVLVFLLFASCSGRIEGALRQDGSAELTLDAALQPEMTRLLSSLARVMGNNAAAGGPLLDGPDIARSMAAAPGISAVSLRNQGPAAIAGTVSIFRVDSFLALPNSALPNGRSAAPFIRYDPAGKLVITMDHDSGPRILLLLSEDVNDYLSSLMAPVATGETLTRAAYLNLVGSMYGRPVADEIAAARIQVSLAFPRSVKEVRGGTSQGGRAQFNVPLVDLLVLEQPLVYEVSW